MHDRIRELRKKHLHLSQAAFGEKLGVSRSVINNIELNALARPEQKLSLIKLMCREFSVNEDWLLNGNEPMFVQPDSFSLDQFAKERGCTELELKILKAYFELDQGTRLAVANHFKERLSSAKNHAPLDGAASADPPVERETDPAPDLAKELAELKHQNQEILRQNQEMVAEIAALKEADSTEAVEAIYRSSSGFAPVMGLSALNITSGTASPRGKAKEKTAMKSGGGASGNAVG